MLVYYINVPINKAGISEFERSDEEMPNVKTFSLTQEEYEALRQSNGLFQEFNEKFGIIIDVCEEERINKEDLADALQIANERMFKKNDNVTEAGILKVIESLECAVAADTFWEIDIYLE